ncbi:MAG TPA: DUF92 domain-containing protein [Candidatus Limnocylindrales bacterium]|nr:DUF92 domain-containing protein [Candidatus Limnocylindrales bacterium]
MSATPFLWGVGFALGGSAIVLVTRQGTPGAALLGFAVAILMVLGFGPHAMAPVALFVLGSGLLTRLGRGSKERQRAAEHDRGRRRAVHVAAKLGVPALLGLAAALAPAIRGAAGTGAAAALAGAFADTAATEVGPVAGGPVVRLQGGRWTRAAHGEPGGVSAAGLAAGAAAALVAAALACAVGIGVTAGAPFVAFGAGFGAMVAESLVAGTRAGRRLGHFGRNVLVSALAAAAGCTLAAALERRAG